VAHPLNRLLVAAAFVLLAALPARGQGIAAGEYEVKAAFLENFGRFVSWPGAVLRPDSPFIIGIVGDDPFGARLDGVMERHSIDGHPVRVVHLRWNDMLSTCQILFVASSEVNHVPQILAAVAGFPVLTVADFDAFTRRGGAIELKMAGDRVRFDINAGATSAAGLRVSSKLLTLAVHVYAAGEVR
jgi:hypothetical protein